MQLNFPVNNYYQPAFCSQPFASTTWPAEPTSFRRVNTQVKMVNDASLQTKHQVVASINNPVNINQQIAISVLVNFYGWCSDSWSSDSWCKEINLIPNKFISQAFFGQTLIPRFNQIGFIRDHKAINQFNGTKLTVTNQHVTIAIQNFSLYAIQYITSIETQAGLHNEASTAVLFNPLLNTQISFTIIDDLYFNSQLLCSINDDRYLNSQLLANIDTKQDVNGQLLANIHTKQDVNSQFTNSISVGRFNGAQVLANIATTSYIANHYIGSILSDHGLNTQTIVSIGSIGDRLNQLLITVSTQRARNIQYNGTMPTLSFVNNQFVSSILSDFYGWCSDSWSSDSWCKEINLIPNKLISQGNFEAINILARNTQAAFEKQYEIKNQTSFNVDVSKHSLNQMFIFIARDKTYLGKPRLKNNIYQKAKEFLKLQRVTSILINTFYKLKLQRF